MAIIKCEACDNEISNKAKECPKCGHPNKKADALSAWQIIGVLAFGMVIVKYFFGGGLEHQAAKEMNKIETQVATESVEQYNIAKRQGDAIQICVQAGMVSAAYLQAKDESNYQTWKATEGEDCKAAGVIQ